MARELASRGAQIILLTQHHQSDPFLVDYIEDLRISTNNQLIYAEQVDLSSLHSIRLFATKWIDNAPPRRLDMIVLCASNMTPRYGKKTVTQDGLEPTWGINYLANFHLLGILSPALRAQPPDRDVRVVFAACSSYIGGDLKNMKDTKSPLPKGKEYGTSKLALMTFASAFQKHLDSYKRPDKQPNPARVVMVDPGLVRTPGMRRWLSMGSLWGLLVYVMMWPLWWLILKSPNMGAQGILQACMEAELGRGVGGRFMKECRDRELLRQEIQDEKVAMELWQFSENQISALEKEGAVKRALDKKEQEIREKEKAKTTSTEEGTSTPINTAASGPKVSRRSKKAG